MAKFTVEFCTDNAAFDEGFAYEVENVFDQVADQLHAGQIFGRLRDTNGNRIGFWHHNTQEG